MNDLQDEGICVVCVQGSWWETSFEETQRYYYYFEDTGKVSNNVVCSMQQDKDGMCTEDGSVILQ